MFGEVFKWFKEIATTVAALLVLIGLLKFIRSWWRGPIELTALIESLTGNPHYRPPVNLEYRDRTGVPMDLTNFVVGYVRNGRGAAYTLSEGYFAGCDPETIKPGAHCVVTLDGGVVEELIVRVDRERQRLFVQSDYTSDEILARISRRPPVVSVPAARRKTPP